MRIRGLLAALVGLGLLGGGTTLALARWWPAPFRGQTLVAAFASYALVAFGIAALIFLVLLLRGRHKIMTSLLVGLSVVGVVVSTSWVTPAFTSEQRGPTKLRVMTVNLQFGQADVAATLAQIKKERIDVVAFEEITPRFLQAAKARGLTKQLPYLAGTPRPLANGTMIASRFKLSDVTPIDVTYSGVQARVAAPTPFTFAAVHTGQPRDAFSSWKADMQWLPGIAERIRGPLIMAGDFNASWDHPQMRNLAEKGRLADAARQAGSGWQPTWPGDGNTTFGIFDQSAVALDHVLTRAPYVATSTRATIIPGSDHRALTADLTLA